MNIPEWVIAIISVIVGALLGFGLNLWKDKLLEKNARRQIALKNHFEELKQVVISEILAIISGVINDHGTLEASTLRGRRTIDDPRFPLLFGFEERDEYQAFQIHYPDTDKKWRELLVEIWKQNEDVETTLKNIEEYITSNPCFPPIKPYPPKEEKVLPETITQIYQAIYSIAQGQHPRYDFSKLEVSDYNNYQHIVLNHQIVAITAKENTEKCKSAFLELQNSEHFRDLAQGLKGNAFQITMNLKTLDYQLKDICSYGLISNKEEHKFEPEKNCSICSNLFY